MKFKDYYSKPQYKLYCDIDGVLADFEKAAYAINPKFKTEWFKIPKGFFASLDKMSDADILMRFLKEHFGSNLYILTALPEDFDDPNAAQDKRDWIERYYQIPQEKVYVVPRENKQNFTENNKNNILIDDRKSNIKEWNAAGGTGILHKRASRTIEELKKILGSIQNESIGFDFAAKDIRGNIVKKGDFVYNLNTKTFGYCISSNFAGDSCLIKPVSFLDWKGKRALAYPSKTSTGIRSVIRTDLIKLSKIESNNVQQFLGDISNGVSGNEYHLG